MKKEEESVQIQEEDSFFGRMNDPTAAASITGPCGDTMEVSSTLCGIALSWLAIAPSWR